MRAVLAIHTKFFSCPTHTEAQLSLCGGPFVTDRISAMPAIPDYSTSQEISSLVGFVNHQRPLVESGSQFIRRSLQAMRLNLKLPTQLGRGAAGEANGESSEESAEAFIVVVVMIIDTKN